MENFNPQISPTDMENIHRAYNDLHDANMALKKARQRVRIYRAVRNAIVMGAVIALYNRRKNRK